MNIFITSITLGSLYCLIALVLVFHFKISGFLNIGVLGSIVLAPYLVATLTGPHTSTILFIAAVIFVMILISILTFLSDVILYRPIFRLPGSMKVIVSVCLLFIILTLIDIVWPSGANLETPTGTKSFEIVGSNILYIDLLTIFIAIVSVGSLFLFLHRTVLGNRLSAYALDQSTARAYGISPFFATTSTAILTGILATIAGVLLGSPGSPRAGVNSVIFYSLIAIAPVIIARHKDILICLIASFVVAFAQTFASANIERLDAAFQNIMSVFSITTEATLGPTFADRFIPFAIALLALIIIPSRWVRDDANG